MWHKKKGKYLKGDAEGRAEGDIIPAKRLPDKLPGAIEGIEGKTGKRQWVSVKSGTSVVYLQRLSIFVES